MLTQSTSDTAVYNATHRTWEEWFAELQERKAAELSHKDIAAMLVDEYRVSAWWAQTITVEYERMIGRREVGQSCEGDFQAGASKTLHGTMDEVFEAWQEFVADVKELNGVAFDSEPTTSVTEKWRYWRVNLSNGSKVNITINQKEPGKVSHSVNHEKLQDADAVAEWKQFWRGYFNEFKDRL